MCNKQIDHPLAVHFILYQAAVLAEDAHALVAKAVGKGVSGWAITDLYIGASNFEQCQTSTLTQYA